MNPEIPFIITSMTSVPEPGPCQKFAQAYLEAIERFSDDYYAQGWSEQEASRLLDQTLHALNIGNSDATFYLRSIECVGGESPQKEGCGT